MYLSHLDANFMERVLTVGIVASRFNENITDRLLKGALRELEQHEQRVSLERIQRGVQNPMAQPEPNQVDLVWVEGAFEIPAALKAMAKTGRYDALLALGCIIRGETPHFEYLAQACANGIMYVSVEASVPIGFGVLTCDTLAQAKKRSEPRGDNKGVDAAVAAISSFYAVSQISAKA